ncbi:glycosyl hydrolase family 28-related protein [Bacillus cereus group sp. BceL078]|uniref:glycosyl hydrolase family 28-related protein n=1 Tax=unclassified Bacillus cereus group TaxID=2750818 RepID=UPI003F2580FE
MPIELYRWGNTAQDRTFRNKTNDNWDKLERTYNNIEEKSEQASSDSTVAKKLAKEANQLSQSVQTQLDTVIISGDSGPEAAQARVDVNGNLHQSLKGRLDYDVNQNLKKIRVLQWDVQTFGAKLDGITDDTIPIQQTINAVADIGGGIVLIPFTPNGCKIVKGDINIPSNVSVLGQGTKVVIDSSQSSKTVFKTNIDKLNKNISIKGISFYSTNDQTRVNGRGQLGSNITAIQLSNTENVVIDNIQIKNFEFGIKCDSYGKHINFANLNFSGTYQTMYFSNVMYIKGNSISSDRTGMVNLLDHHFYINSATKYLTLSDVTMVGGDGYAIDVKDDSQANAPSNIIFTDVVVEDIGGCIVAENGAEAMISNVKAKFGTLKAGKAFGILSNGKLRISNFTVVGRCTLFSALDSPRGEIIVDNGIVDRLATRLVVSNYLGYIRVSNVKFLDIISEDGAGVYNMDGYSTDLLEFYNCHFIMKSRNTNDPFSHRSNVTRYYDCIFDANEEISTINYTYPQGEAVFKNCLVRGRFNRFEWTNSSGKIYIFDCIDERDGSIFNSKLAIKRIFGSGSPEGIYNAPVGSEFIRSDGGPGTSRYIKESGVGNIGWIPK